MGGAHLLRVLYLELFALPAMFAVRMHRVFGLALIGMHWGVMHTMNISFASGIMPLVLFLAASPFAPRGFDAVETLKALPGVAFVRRRLGHGRPLGEPGVGADPALLQPVISWLLIVYVVVGFSRFSPSKQRFEHDIFPISAMPMFWLMRNDAPNVARLQSVRAQLRAEPWNVLDTYEPPRPKKRKRAR